MAIDGRVIIISVAYSCATIAGVWNVVPVKKVVASVTVYMSGFRTNINGMKYSFQELMNDNTRMFTSAGRARGRRTRWSVCSRDAPSIVDASRMSFGTVSK